MDVAIADCPFKTFRSYNKTEEKKPQKSFKYKITHVPVAVVPIPISSCLESSPDASNDCGTLFSLRQFSSSIYSQVLGSVSVQPSPLILVNKNTLLSTAL
jgi:hypothetical protein